LEIVDWDCVIGIGFRLVSHSIRLRRVRIRVRGLMCCRASSLDTATEPATQVCLTMCEKEGRGSYPATSPTATRSCRVCGVWRSADPNMY
jgi:hypothetical protein